MPIIDLVGLISHTYRLKLKFQITKTKYQIIPKIPNWYRAIVIENRFPKEIHSTPSPTRSLRMTPLELGHF